MKEEKHVISNTNNVCVSLLLHILELNSVLGTLSLHMVGESALPKNSKLYWFLQTYIPCLLLEEKKENWL